MTSQNLVFGEQQQQSHSERWIKALKRRTEWRGAILLAVVVLVALVSEPLVFQAYGVTLSRVALIGLVAVGLTVVLIMGELDLSVASTVVLSGVVMAKMPTLFLGIVAALATGLVIGAINAFFVVKVGINSFIATLGMLFVLSGLALVVSDAQPIPLQEQDISTAIRFGLPFLGPITPRIVLFTVVFLLLLLFLTRVAAGRENYAVGGNRQAARDAGIPVNRRLVTGFMLCAFIAAMAGVIDTMERTAADPTSGSTILLSSIAAAIIGGVALTGGRGTILGTLIGAAALAILEVGLTLSGVQVDIQQIFIGAVLLLAVMTDPASLRSAGASFRTFLAGLRARGSQPDLTPPTSTSSS